MKKCPFCAEEIQDEAIVCRYCGRELEQELPPEDRKRCPHCAEWIRAEANVCRYCGREFKEERKIIKHKLCPNCGNTFSNSMVRPNCPYCGVALVETDEPISEVQESKVSGYLPEKPVTVRPWYRQTWFYICTIIFSPLFVLLALTDKKPPYWVRIVFWLILISWIPLCLLLSGMMTDSFFPNLGIINEIFSNISANIPVTSYDATSTPLPAGKPTFNILSTVTQTRPQPTYTIESWKPSQTPQKIECVKWDEVNKNHVGKELCVYGAYWQFIRWRMKRNRDIPPEFDLGESSVFFERDYIDTTFLFYHVGGSKCGHTSDCVMGTGIIQEMNGMMFIDMKGGYIYCCD